MQPATSTLSDSVISDDLGGDYDVISDAGGVGPPSESLGSSIAELDRDVENDLENAKTYGVKSVFGFGEKDEAGPGTGLTSRGNGETWEPKPSAEAILQFELADVDAEDVQSYVRKCSEKGTGTGSAAGTIRGGAGVKEKTVRVYVDGVFDVLHVGTMLRLRQAKLSFPSVHLIVGVFSDEQVRVHGSLSFPATAVPPVPHLERCELVRHVRWVDEVLPSAPFVIDSAFLVRNKIDYVAVEEGSSVDPKLEKVRLGGYDLAKTLGRAIPTRRSRNVVAQSLVLASPSQLPTPPESASHIPQTRTPKPSTVGEIAPPAFSGNYNATRSRQLPIPSSSHATSPPDTDIDPVDVFGTDIRRLKETEERTRRQARQEMAERERLRKEREIIWKAREKEMEAKAKLIEDSEEEETPEPKEIFGLGI